jgi:hypothetical protein
MEDQPMRSTTQAGPDAHAVKSAAAGRWPSILTALAGIPADVQDGGHHPCPGCGGTDRFRMIDPEAGAVYCNGCFSSGNGDGIAAIQHFGGVDFKTALRMLADHLGISNGNGRATTKGKKAADEATLTKGIKPVDHKPEILNALLESYGKAKPPITAEGVGKCGGTPVDWCGHRCIRLNGREPIDSTTITAVALLRADGKPFPAHGKVAERKTHTTKGSVNSWLVSGDVAAAHTILDVEGITDLLAVVSAGLPDGWVAVTNTAGAKARGKLPRPWAKGKKSISAGDADEPGQDGRRRSAAAYHKAGAAEVLLGQLPYAIEKDHGKDLRDWLLEGHKLDELPTVAVTAEQAAEWAKKPSAAGRIIIIGTDESRVVDEAIEALATRENIYQRGGALVQVVEGTEPPKGIARPKDAPRIAPMRFPRIREQLADAAGWYRVTGDGEEPERIHPPDWTTKALAARDQWPNMIPRIEAVVESPILRADGTVLQTPGYDVSTGILFRPQVTFPPVPDSPTRADALRAVEALLEVVEDFPFASPAHRAAWLAGTLTPQSRYAFHGPAPLFLIDANTPGCGKSLAADAAFLIAAGREAARMSLPRDDDEFRKRITALAVAGEPLILIDNIPDTGTFGSPSLDAALTATSWSDRILGQTAMASAVPMFATWWGTGNNVILAADTSRRVVHIRLESPEESPEERSGFHHADLLAWVRSERPRLTTAAVAILAAYCAAGRPDMRLRPWGSFEAWSDLVRQAIVWAGLPDPGTTRTELTRQADREATALRQLIVGWDEIDASGAGMTVVEIIRTLAEHPNEYDAIRGALWELCPPKDGKTLNPRSVGMRLHHLRQRVIAGRALDRRDAREGAIWSVSQPEASGTCGTNTTSGTSLDSARARAHTRTRENPQATRNSPASPVSPADCSHTDVAETPTSDGYVNRTCRSCGKNLGCRKMEVVSP